MLSFSGFRLEDGSPIYQQIIRYLEQGIAAGTIRDGDGLPSRRVLSAQLGVNPNTVQKAYRLLEEEGLIQSHPGAKSCVAADEAADLGRPDPQAERRARHDGQNHRGHVLHQRH